MAFSTYLVPGGDKLVGKFFAYDKAIEGRMTAAGVVIEADNSRGAVDVELARHPIQTGHCKVTKV